MMLKTLFAFFLCGIFFIGINAQNKQAKKNTKQTSAQEKSVKKEDDKKKKDSQETFKTVTEGKGIEGIVVGKSTMDDVVKKFGKNYSWIANKKYSYQMNYNPLGLAFYMCQSDKRKEIFLIEVKPPYKAKTKRGVILGKSTKEETEKIYGKPKDGFEYRGVSFYYNTYGKRRIISEIDVTENAGIRQCKENK